MILVSPYPKTLRNGKRNPKEYPWWTELVALLPLTVRQVGGGIPIPGTLQVETTLTDVRTELQMCDVWLAVDNFLQHMAHQFRKPGVVLWGKSDPVIFGYPENLNLLKDRSCLRQRQFDIWESEPYDASVFVKPEEVVSRMRERWPQLWAGERAVA